MTTNAHPLDTPTLLAERGGTYDVGPRDREPDGSGTELEAALDGVESALARLAAVDLQGASRREVLEASVRVQTARNRFDAQQARLLERADRTRAYRDDGARSLASWYAAHTHLDRAVAHRLVNRAKKLRILDDVRAAFEAGTITSDHVDPIARAAIPQRHEAMIAAQDALVRLAQHGTPREVARAVKLVKDSVDDDGTEACPVDTGTDPRRELFLSTTVDRLGALNGTLAPVATELLHSLLERLAVPDGRDVPEDQRRTAAQIRHDAFLEILRRAAGASDETRQGTPAHVSLMIDLRTVFGDEAAATFESALLHAGEIDDATARGLLAAAGVDDSTPLVNAVLSMGPYRPVAFGRTKRGLPGRLREILSHVHRSCRGPYCDQPAVWADVDHTEPWAEGGETSIENSAPACAGRDGHHEMVTTGGWSYTLDRDTGVATFRSPSGRVIRTHPPPRRC